MKKTLDKAIKNGEIPKIREILISMVSRPGGNVASIQEITEAITKTPGLFEPDDGKVTAKSAKELTRSELEKLKEAVTTNFSLAEFRLLAEAREIEHSDPHFFARREKEAAETSEVVQEEKFQGDTLVIEEEIEVENDKPKVAVANVRDIPDTDDKVADRPFVSPSGELEETDRELAYEATCSSGDGMRKFGYVVLLLGLAGAIVGVSVPVHFLIGLGIGVLMLGSAIVYMAIPKKE